MILEVNQEKFEFVYEGLLDRIQFIDDRGMIKILKKVCRDYNDVDGEEVDKQSIAKKRSLSPKCAVIVDNVDGNDGTCIDTEQSVTKITDTFFEVVKRLNNASRVIPSSPRHFAEKIHCRYFFWNEIVLLGSQRYKVIPINNIIPSDTIESAHSSILCD
jgi:hypothetical protein